MAVDVIIDPSSGQIYWNDAAGSGTQTIAISGNATNAINIVGYSNFFSPGGGGVGTNILATFNDSATSTFVPGTNAYDLGSSALRWNFYGTGGNFTGVISTSSSTASTSTTTGALTVTGGVGIGGSLWTNTSTVSSISGVKFLNSRAQNGFQINANSSYTFNITDEANNQRLNYHGDSNRTEFTGNNATHEIRLIHSNNSSYTGFKANSSGTVTYTLPAGDGTANQVLYTNGSAALGWTTASGSAAGSSTQVQYNQGGAFGATSSLTYDPAAQKLSAPFLAATNSQANEGGEITMSLPTSGSTLATSVTVDIYQNRIRFFETGSPNKGAYIDLSACSSSVGTNLLVGSGASGLTSLNGLTSSTQTFATGTSGSDFNISSSTSTHTFNIPYAGSGATGLVTTQTQTIAGSKTFSSQTIISDTTTSTTTATGAMLIFGGLGVSGQINSVSLVTSGNAVINGNLQFKGIGTFGDAITDTITSLARYASDLLPSADNSYDLGNNTLGWRNFKVSGVGTIASLNVSSSTASTSTTTGALTVTGGVGIGGTINAGTRNLSYSAANLLAGFATSVNSYAQIVLQNASTGNAASSDFIVNNDQSTDSTYYGSMGMNSSGFTGSGSLNAPNAVYFTSTTGDLVLGSTTANILRFVYNSGSSDSMQITGTAVSVLYTTGSSSTTTGALTIGGGVGIGGSLWTAATNFSSISGVGFSNSVITSGVWSGTAVSATNGGTGQVSYAIGDILYASSTTALSKLSAGTAGSVLASGGTGAAPYWKVDATGSGGAPGGSNYQLQYNNASAFGGASRLLYNALLAEEFLITSPYQTSINASLNIGLGTTSFDGTSLGRFTGSSNGTVFAINQISGFTGNFADFQLAGSSKFTIGYDGKITVVGVYSLPTTAGTAGSVLTSNGTGNQLYWSAPGAAGGGSGTVTSGTAGSVAYYTGSGTTVGGAPGFNYTTSGTASTVNIFGGGTAGTYLFTVQAYSATSVRVGIGTNLPQYELEINGEISATNKSFVINHPTKPGKKLRYGSLEGPENGVYVRGELKDSNVIETPDHWVGLVYPDSFTVTLTPIGRFAHLYVEKIEDYKVFIADAYMNPIHCYYTIWAERKDIPKLITEY